MSTGAAVHMHVHALVERQTRLLSLSPEELVRAYVSSTFQLVACCVDTETDGHNRGRNDRGRNGGGLRGTQDRGARSQCATQAALLVPMF
jgi:hypothetical protein